MTHCADPEEYSPVAMDHAASPRHYGVLSPFNGRARITGHCGDTMEFWLEIRDDQVERISFITDGCAPSRASGSMAASLVAGRPLMEAAVLSRREILDALGGLPPPVEHCAQLAADTLQAACLDYFRRRDEATRPQIEGEEAQSTEKSEPPPSRSDKIQRKILVLSSKGGVGKSTVAVNLAAALSEVGKRVGVLDADIHNPAIPTMLGLEQVGIANRGRKLLPARIGDLGVISLGLLPDNPEEASIWRGPEKSQAIGRFLRDGEWGELDFLIIDCPPGLGDEILSLRELAGDGLEALIVTTPQKVAAQAAQGAVFFCRRQGVEVLGVVENMGGFTCPECGRVTRILRAGGGRKISDDLKLTFLGSIPIDPAIAECADRGRVYLEHYPATPAAESMRRLAARINNLT